jgi:uncharacterized membrane protein YidH (DUF202 family)
VHWILDINALSADKIVVYHMMRVLGAVGVRVGAELGALAEVGDERLRFAVGVVAVVVCLLRSSCSCSRRRWCSPRMLSRRRSTRPRRSSSYLSSALTPVFLAVLLLIAYPT